MASGDESASWGPELFEQQIGVLGDRVRDVRVARGWSQQDLGEMTGIGRTNVSRIEGGKKNITLEVLWRLAARLEVHWADLLDEGTIDSLEVERASSPFQQQLINFGTRAYQARAIQRLSQQAVADRTGIGRSAISWIEDGTQNVTLETLSRLAAGLGVHWADLLDDRQANPPQPGRTREQRG